MRGKEEEICLSTAQTGPDPPEATAYSNKHRYTRYRSVRITGAAEQNSEHLSCHHLLHSMEEIEAVVTKAASVPTATNVGTMRRQSWCLVW
jgi:hypothetical protein